MNENQAVRVFKKSEDGSKFVAEYFANVLLRQDFTGYINEHLAADFACALADGLHALQKHCDGFAEQAAFQRDARLGALKELAIVERQRDELLKQRDELLKQRDELLKQRDELLAVVEHTRRCVPYVGFVQIHAGSKTVADRAKMRVSLDRKVAVDDYVMLDAAIHPPPKHPQVLCGSVKWGTTAKGYFDPAHHDCWLPMPKFPDSVKNRYRIEVENGKT